MKKLFTGVMLLFLACFLFACDQGNQTSVTPTPSTPIETIVSATSVKITASKKAIAIGETLQLSATVSPSSTTQTVTWSTSDERVAKVDENGLVTGVGNGSVVIVATPTVGGKTGKVQITVGETSDVTYPDLGGYTIRIAYDNGRTGEIDPRNDIYLDTDKEIRTRAFEKVEELYNCTIEFGDYPVTSDVAKWDYILQQGANNKADFDFYWIPTAKISEFAALLVDLKDYYSTWGYNYLSDADHLAKSYREGMYGAGISTNRPTANDCIMVFNANLLESLGLEEPGKLFLEDKWTMDDFKAWIIDAQEKLNQKSQQDSKTYYAISGALNYYVYSFAHSCGVALASTANNRLQVSDQVVIDAATLMHELYDANCVDPENLTDEKTTSWNEGRALLCIGSSYFVNYMNRWTETLWGVGETSYGFAPFPYGNDMHYTDAKFASFGETAYVMPKARENDYAQFGPDVTAENIYRAYMDLSYWTNYYKEQDPSYDESLVDLTNARQKWGTEYSVQAWLYFAQNLDKLALFDPIKQIANMHYSSYARAVAAYISPEWGSKNGYTKFASYMEAVQPTLSELQQAFVEKFTVK